MRTLSLLQEAKNEPSSFTAIILTHSVCLEKLCTQYPLLISQSFIRRSRDAEITKSPEGRNVTDETLCSWL